MRLAIHRPSFWSGAAAGLLCALLTLCAEKVTLISSEASLALLQKACVVLIFPGLFVVALVGSTIPGAFLNFSFYSILGLIVSLRLKRQTAKA